MILLVYAPITTVQCSISTLTCFGNFIKRNFVEKKLDFFFKFYDMKLIQIF
uniref:Uncharacterized protein n=1 Tax=viral metagenome TaxID=1070528 RepID=A0A6C0J0A5_9ZZZZ